MTIDPGETTGIALFNPKHALMMTGSFETSTQPQYEEFMRFFHRISPAVVVIERLPLNAEHWVLYMVESMVRSMAAGYELHLINPGHWKPWIKKTKKGVSVTARHQKDAANMGIFFLTMRDKNE